MSKPFFCLCLSVVISVLCSSAHCSTSSLVLCSDQDTFSILYQIHILCTSYDLIFIDKLSPRVILQVATVLKMSQRRMRQHVDCFVRIFGSWFTPSQRLSTNLLCQYSALVLPLSTEHFSCHIVTLPLLLGPCLAVLTSQCTACFGSLLSSLFIFFPWSLIPSSSMLSSR